MLLPNDQKKFVNHVATYLILIFISACSVEDPYETGPSEQQQDEINERESTVKTVIPYSVEIKDSTNKPISGLDIKIAGKMYQSNTEGVVLIDTLTLGNYPVEITHPDYHYTFTTINISKANNIEAIDLSNKNGDEITLVFAGDTMFGRRFMNPSITTMNNSVPDLPNALINKSNAATAAIEITKYV